MERRRKLIALIYEEPELAGGVRLCLESIDYRVCEFWIKEDMIDGN